MDNHSSLQHSLIPKKHLGILLALDILEQLSLQSLKLESIMTSQAEHAAELRRINAQHEKARAEQKAAFKKLQDALEAAGNTTPEVDEATAAMGAAIQVEDDENPDAEQPTDQPAT